MDPIEAAIEELESLGIGEKVNYARVAREYGVDRNTLSRRHRGVQGTSAQKAENERLLTQLQEKELIKYINRLTKRGLPPTREIVCNFTLETAGKQAGKR
jgi:transposase-like protein